MRRLIGSESLWVGTVHSKLKPARGIEREHLPTMDTGTVEEFTGLVPDD